MAFLNESDIEQADINFFVETLGYTHINAWEKQLIGRDNLKEVVLRDRLKKSLIKLNSQIPVREIETAIAEITKNRVSLTPLAANKEVYELIKNGIAVIYKNAQGRDVNDYVKIIDFKDPKANDFLLVSQLSIQYQQGPTATRRPDLLLYVNGLPLVMIELKNATVKVKSGYDSNLKDYQRDIPQLFWYNLMVCISNGIQTRIGSSNSPWDHFFSWLKLTDTTLIHDQATRAEIEAESEQTGEHLSLKLFGEGLC